MARLYLNYPIKLLSIISQLEGGLHSLVAAVVDITAGAVNCSLDGHDLEVVGVGAIAIKEIALGPEKTHTTIA